LAACETHIVPVLGFELKTKGYIRLNITVLYMYMNVCVEYIEEFRVDPNCTAIFIQGGHLPEKPGKVREFHIGQEKVRKIVFFCDSHKIKYWVTEYY